MYKILVPQVHSTLSTFSIWYYVHFSDNASICLLKLNFEYMTFTCTICTLHVHVLFLQFELIYF